MLDIKRPTVLLLEKYNKFDSHNNRKLNNWEYLTSIKTLLFPVSQWDLTISYFYWYLDPFLDYMTVRQGYLFIKTELIIDAPTCCCDMLLWNHPTLSLQSIFMTHFSGLHAFSLLQQNYITRALELFTDALIASHSFY